MQAGKARPGNLLTRSLIRLHTPELLLHTFWTVTEIGIRWGTLLRLAGLRLPQRSPAHALSRHLLAIVRIIHVLITSPIVVTSGCRKSG